MADEQLKLENQLCFRLYNVSKELTRMYMPLLKKHGLTYPQYLVMLVLWQSQKGIKVNEIGRLLNLDSGTLSPLLKRLEKAEYIVRQRCTDDERTVLISLTKHGVSLKEQVKSIPSTLVKHSPLSNEETHQLISLLDKMKASLTADK